MEAASRRAERESQRRYRQLQRDAKEQAKMEALSKRLTRLRFSKTRLERLTSVHKESPEMWDWNNIYNTPPPAPPERSSVREGDAAAAALNAFKPGFMEKLLGRAEAKRQALAQAVETAMAQDEQEYQTAIPGLLFNATPTGMSGANCAAASCRGIHKHTWMRWWTSIRSPISVSSARQSSSSPTTRNRGSPTYRRRRPSHSGPDQVAHLHRQALGKADA